MRGFVIATVLLATATGGSAAVRDDAVNPAAARWRAAGDAALAAKKPADAIDAYEGALALDPKDATAFVGIARAYDLQRLPGRAIRYYREALALQPNDLAALEGQGEALIARGATTRARVNLDRIRTLCKGDCPAAKKLEIALAAPPPVPAKTASAEPAKPETAKN